VFWGFFAFKSGQAVSVWNELEKSTVTVKGSKHSLSGLWLCWRKAARDTRKSTRRLAYANGESNSPSMPLPFAAISIRF
jgi:hypothetical protein